MAAVLACGPGSALSHRSAAVLWGLLKPRRGLIHVSTTVRSGHVQRAGICLHRSRSLRPVMTMWRHRIPVTTVARTIADLDAVSPAWEVRRAIR
jgi:predicted transcriptional regulator of viral defense system